MWFFLFVCMSLLLLRCYILHLLIFCVSLLFFALGFCFVSCFFLFVSSFLCPCRCLASLVLSCIATGFGSRMEGFCGWGGQAQCQKRTVHFTPGCGHELAQEGKRIADFPGRQQRFRGRHSTEDGASWLKKEKLCRFRGRHSKEAKDSKVLFYFWFLNGQAHSSYLSISAVWDFYRRWGVQSRKGQGSSPMCLPLSITLIKCNARVFVSTQGCRALNQANV